MKRLIILIMLPIFSLLFFSGCGNEGNVDDLKKLYNEITGIYIEEGENIFFSDDANPNTINISYFHDVQNEINNPIVKEGNKYRTYYYAQLILNHIFNFYEDHNEDFYLHMSSKEYKEKDIEKVYEKLNNLKEELIDFKSSYMLFNEQTKKEGLSNVLDIYIKNYTFELNQVIEKSFDFMYEFDKVYTKYCIEDMNAVNEKVLNYKVDKSYLDIAHIVYLENFKTFSIAVEGKGVCDISPIIGLNSKFNLLDDLGNLKNVSNNIIVNLDEKSQYNLSTMELINNFDYYMQIFNQNYHHYINTYNTVYDKENNSTNKYNSYRFDLMGSGSFESYLNGLSVVDRASVNLLTNFIDECYNSLVEKLKLIVE